MGALKPYLAGWPILLPTFLILGGLSVYHARRRSEWWAVQITLIWLAACVYTYVTADVGRFLGVAALRWLFMVATILLATGVPGVLVVALVRHPAMQARRLGAQLAVAVLVALTGVPLAGLISSWMFRAFHAVA